MKLGVEKKQEVHKLIKTPSKYEPRYSSFDILQLYRNNSKQIFSNEKGFFSLFGSIVKSKYAASGISEMLDRYFDDTTLDQTLAELIIPATLENNLTRSYLFSRHESRANSAKNLTIKNVLMATTAAPTFFPSHEISGMGTFVDGGVTLNNPAMAAYTCDIGSQYNIPKDKMYVVSMGTGNYLPDPLKRDRYHGSLFWAKNLHNVALPPQEGNTDSDLSNILGNNYVR